MSMETDREEQAAAHVHGICLKTGPPRRVGVELEWLVRDARDPSLPIPAERIAAAVAVFGRLNGAVPDRKSAPDRPALPHPNAAPDASRGLIPRPRLPSSAAPGRLPSGASLTAEPGGQLELSSLPADSLAGCVAATITDMTALRAAADAAGLELAGYGLDPLRPPRRVLDLPRYAAMEAFFDRSGPWGRQMMCGTASVQVCLDAGDDGDGFTGYRYRWRLVHALGPVLVAAFANSPLRRGRPTGWRSSRQQVWAYMDPGRTRPLDSHPDPRDAWAAYALDAELMLVRDPASENWFAPPGVTFRTWLRGTNGVNRTPTSDDLAYHLSTLFPPVRPRGYLELRMIDAQPDEGWIVPLAVTTALLHDERAADLALAATESLAAKRLPANSPRPKASDRPMTGDPWLRAARLGPSDPEIAQASRECFDAARGALDRMGVPDDITEAVDAFIERYASRDRCPADDLSPGDDR
jgi:ergothioneine biosynthesis glutamate--cysteine ligase EgtA